MINFEYGRATDVADAVRWIASEPGAKFIAGGTNLIDLMKENVERPARLIDISRLPLNKVEETADGSVRSANPRNTPPGYANAVAEYYKIRIADLLSKRRSRSRSRSATRTTPRTRRSPATTLPTPTATSRASATPSRS